MLYRYYNYTTGDGYVSTEHLGLMTFPVIKYTKCGAWIVDPNGRDRNEKYINFSHKSAFAYRTKEDAFINYRYRKLRQIKILRGQLERAIEASKLTMDSISIGSLEIGRYE